MIQDIRATPELMKYIKIDPSVIKVMAYTKLSPAEPNRRAGTRWVTFPIGEILQDSSSTGSAKQRRSNAVVKALVEIADKNKKGVIRDPETNKLRKICTPQTIATLFEGTRKAARTETDWFFDQYKIEKPTEDGQDADRAFIKFALEHIKVQDDEGATVHPGACTC